MTVLRLGVVMGCAALAVACSVDAGTASGGGGYGPVPCLNCQDDAGTDGGGTVSAGEATPSKNLLLGIVDDGAKMNSSPGEGVGVFTEYDEGGHWSIWWTCDTKRTMENCPFEIKVTSDEGTITKATAVGFTSSDKLTTPATPSAGPQGGIVATTTTTTGTSGVTFDTEPGARVQLSATVGGLYNGQFLFWVQNGKVNGGYTGAVSDPLLLQGRSP
jgi:hypothetical protein